MRQATQKISQIFLVMALVIFTFAFIASPSMALAAEAVETPAPTEIPETSDQGGVEVRTLTDKGSYQTGETAKLSVSVKNTNDYDLQDVEVEYSIPSNISASGEKTQKIDKLAAGETKVFEVDAKVTADQSGPVDVASYVYDTNTNSSGGTDFSIKPLGIVAIVLVVLIIAAIIFLIIKLSKKKGKKALSLFLVFLMAFSALYYNTENKSIVVSADEEDEEESDMFNRVSVHDPSIVKDPESGYYYIFGSHMAWAKSKDLKNWETFSMNINTDFNDLFKEPWEWSLKGGPNQSLGGRMWAPDVIWNETMKKWCMYMSIDGDNWCSSICLLTADKIEGPYEYKGIVVYSGMGNSKTNPDISSTDVTKVLGENPDLKRYGNTSDSCINCIDPSVKYDDNGDLYMVYGSWSAGIYMLKLDTKTGLRDYNQKYETKRDVSDAYLGYKIAGGHYNSGEAPYLLHNGKYWYLFISYGGLEAVGGYQIRIYRSEKINGPYVDQNGQSPIFTNSLNPLTVNRGEKIFGSYDMSGLNQIQVAQGHNSALVDDDGKIYLVYHTRFKSNTGKIEIHQVRVHQMFVNEDGWLVAAPYEYTGEELASNQYSSDEVSGKYDYIYHEPTQRYNVVSDKQLGIVGYGETTDKEVELQKNIIIDNHISKLKYKIKFSHKGAPKVTIKSDGSVTGDATGTWKFTNGNNVEMQLDGITYKGVFLKQKDEDSVRKERMTFTILGKNVTAWGVESNKDDDTSKDDEEE